MLNIVLFGPPGSGKGTQAKFLEEKYQTPQISTGDLFRFNLKNETELGALVKSYMDKGQLVPDEVTTNMLVDHLDNNPNAQGYIFDGYPRTTSQAEALDKILADKIKRNLENYCNLYEMEYILPSDSSFREDMNLWGKNDEKKRVV